MGNLTLKDLSDLIEGKRSYVLTAEQKGRIEKAFVFLSEYSDKRIIYGINTGFGPMAQYRVDKNDYSQLQYNLIRSHSNGIGQKLTPEQIKIVMILRLHSLALGLSGCSPQITEQIESYLTHEIYPIIYYHGGVGASGDLVQLAHLGLGLIGEGMCYYKGNEMPVADALKSAGLEPAKLLLRDGLAIVNGTSCMTGLGAVNAIHAHRLLSMAVKISSHLNELVESFDDSFSKELNDAKLHEGQREIARMMREFTDGSKLIKHRDGHVFEKENGQNGQEQFAKKVQEYYSIRCVPQILGPIKDTILGVTKVLEEEFNSASDNPIIDLEKQQVFHGGNFHGDYVSFEMDKLKLAVIKMTMLLERQLNFMLNDKLNGRFPPFLNAGKIGLNYGLQGMQFTATSTTAENQTLGNSMYIHSIPCNNDNQDIVSMGTNSARLAEVVIHNCAQVMAITLLGIAQATDCSDLHEQLSPSAKALYQKIRSIAPKLVDDVPFSGYINLLKMLPLEETLEGELYS
jgi:histidine ammonia-lyase